MILVAAVPQELQRFRELLPNFATAELGVGPLAAAVAVARLAPRPSAVVLVGTCGAYPGAHLSIGERVVVRVSRFVDPSVVLGTSTSITDDVLEADEGLVDRFRAIGRAVTAATTVALTTNDDLARGIRRTTGADVEHLETHGVAVACAAAGIPFVALLAVANFVGESGRAEWREHHRRVEDALGEAVAGLL